jgi:DMSO/TMAO reductase YedYZ molybdopterin-dependent catalytic subunit
MRYLAHGILVASVSAGLVAGCPAVAHADGPTEPAAVAVTGDVHNPRSFTLNELRAFPAETKSVTFESDGGSQSHTYVGALLDDVVSVADPVVNASAKNAALTMAIRATGVDGYTVAVALPEISPGFTANPALVAYTEDGEPLDRPRLVVPGDLKGGRYVNDLVELRLIDLRD